MINSQEIIAFMLYTMYFYDNTSNINIIIYLQKISYSIATDNVCIRTASVKLNKDKINSK